MTAIEVRADPNAATTNAAQQNSDSSKWELLWQDEFIGDQLDNTKWQLCKRATSDWNNTMSDDPRLLKIKDGALHLYGIVNDKKDQDPVPYLTAGVTSKDKFSFQYGKAQVRARFKSAQGAWPAIWMLGNEKKMARQWRNRFDGTSTVANGTTTKSCLP